MNFRSYPIYKYSGVDWLGEIPEHWQLKRLKYIANRVEEKVELNGDIQLPYIGLEQIESGTGRLLPLNPDFVPAGVTNRFKSGETLFGKLRPYLAKACNIDFDGLCSSEILTLRTVNYDRRFLLYCFITPGFISLIDSSTYGVKMPRAEWDFIGSCKLPVPPLSEQQRISEFLDVTTNTIDKLIEKKGLLIKKMKERRLGLISRAVMHGLITDGDTNTTYHSNHCQTLLKNEWLDAIPKHWCKSRVKNVCSVRGRIGFRGYTTDDLVNEGEGALTIGASQVQSSGLLDFTNPVFISWNKYYESPEIMIEVGDVLVVQRGSTCGKVGLVNRDIGHSTINPSMVLLKQPHVDSRYLLYWLLSSFVQSTFSSYLSATAIPMLSQEQIGNIPIYLPPAPEQHAIANYLDLETKKIDNILSKLECDIDRLREYRSAFITDCVTGKIDVSGVAI